MRRFASHFIVTSLDALTGSCWTQRNDATACACASIYIRLQHFMQECMHSCAEWYSSDDDSDLVLGIMNPGGCILERPGLTDIVPGGMVTTLRGILESKVRFCPEESDRGTTTVRRGILEEPGLISLSKGSIRTILLGGSCEISSNPATKYSCLQSKHFFLSNSIVMKKDCSSRDITFIIQFNFLHLSATTIIWSNDTLILSDYLQLAAIRS